MSKSVASNYKEIYASNGNHFIILFLTLFSLLLVFTTYIYSEEVFISLQKKYVVPQLEKKFGFKGRDIKFKINENEYETFIIESVEPNSLFDQAGFKSGDIPIYSGCRFTIVGKTDEAMFYSQLGWMRDEFVSTFTVLSFDKYQKYLKSNRVAFPRERKVFLSAKSRKCVNFQ